jgi:hypothetical protein
MPPLIKMILSLKLGLESRGMRIACARYDSMLIFRKRKMKCKMTMTKANKIMTNNNRMKTERRKLVFVRISIRKLLKRLKLVPLLVNPLSL